MSSKRKPQAAPTSPAATGEADLAERIAACNAAISTACTKYELGITPVSGFSPDGRLQTEVRFVSTRKAKESIAVAQP